MRTESASSRVNEGAVSKKGAEPSPTDDQLADDSHGDQADAMEVDHDDDEWNSSRQTFPERPSEVLLKGETRETLREAMPDQPRDEDSCEG